MTTSNTHAGFIERCLQGKSTPAFVEALRSDDLIGLAVVGCFDAPSKDRLTALRLLPNGPETVTALAVAIIPMDAPPTALLDHINDQIDDHGTELPVSESQAGQLLELLGEDMLEDTQARIVFDWLTPHCSPRCHQLAADAVSEAAPGLTTLLARQVELLGISDTPAHHAAVLGFAQRCADADQASPALTALAALGSVHDADVAPAVAVLHRLLVSGQAITDQARDYLARLSLEQVVTTIRALDLDGTTAPRFDQQLLPYLFSTHADSLVATLTADWWPPSSRTWLLDAAPWGDHDDQLLIQALTTATDDGDDDAAVRIRRRVVQRVEQTAGESAPINSMPRLGTRTLLSEALQGTIVPDDQLLAQALDALDPVDRSDEYRRAKWSTPKRAQRLAAVVAAVDIDGVTKDLTDQAFALKDSTFAAWLGPVASKADEELADALVGLAAGRPEALQALADTTPGAEALTRRWEADDDIDAFRALANAESDHPRVMDHIADAVRNYDGKLTTPDRRDLIGRLDPPERAALLTGIIDDRKKAPPHQPEPGLLESALELLAGDIAGTDPGNQLASIADVCRNQPRPAVRTAAYGVLASCSPTRPVVELLLERRDVEKTSGVTPAVERALDAVAETLTEIVATTRDKQRVEALELLDAVDPTRALPHARRILEEQIEDPAHRILAIQIIGNHGDESYLDLLKNTSDDEPNPEAQEVLKHAIRQLEIGDIADAHRRLGELAGVNSAKWNDLTPEKVWGDKKDTLVAALVRINKHQVNGDRESTVDQLGAELAKLVLYHTIEATGTELNISKADRAAIADNTMPYGDLVKRPQLSLQWEFVGSLHELYKLRREHLSPQGTWDPYMELTHEEYELSLFLFTRGAGPCLDRLASAQVDS